MLSSRVLVDTSVWIYLIGQGKDVIHRLIFEQNAFCHPFVIGEFAGGNLGGRWAFTSKD